MILSPVCGWFLHTASSKDRSCSLNQKEALKRIRCLVQEQGIWPSQEVTGVAVASLVALSSYGFQLWYRQGWLVNFHALNFFSKSSGFDVFSLLSKLYTAKMPAWWMLWHSTSFKGLSTISQRKTKHHEYLGTSLACRVHTPQKIWKRAECNHDFKRMILCS